MHPGIEQYEPMWTTEKHLWLLERTREGGLVPLRRGNPPHALVIEDDAIAAEVCRRMQTAGVETIGVIGREMASASATEARHRKTHPADSVLRHIKYDPDRGELSLFRFVASEADDVLHSFVKDFANLPPDRVEATRAGLTIDDFYTLLTFARRCALVSVREHRPETAADGVIAVAAIDADRVDWRDVALASALLGFALRRSGGDASEAFTRAAGRSDGKTAEILGRFAREPVESLRPWGLRLVDSRVGAALIDDWGYRYKPSVDLAGMAVEIGNLVERDSYRVTGIGVGSNLPAVWVRGGDPNAVKAASSSIRACAIVNASLRPGVDPRAKDQHFLAFVGEADNPEHATLIAAAAKSQVEVQELGVSHDRLWCVAVGRSVVKGVAPYERAGSLERFKAPIADLLSRR